MKRIIFIGFFLFNFVSTVQPMLRRMSIKLAPSGWICGKFVPTRRVVLPEGTVFVPVNPSVSDQELRDLIETMQLSIRSNKNIKKEPIDGDTVIMFFGVGMGLFLLGTELGEFFIAKHGDLARALGIVKSE
jgi:hypothetical protein